VVADPAQADLAIIRAPAPYECEHPNFFFGSRQQEGRLAFMEKDAAYAELLRVSPLVPTVFLTTLERPLILTNIRPHATALLGLITGEVSPGRHLPFELPSSVEEVRQQRSDLPHDSQSPLFPFGFGLHY
jgi:beta-glucosidase